MHRDGRVLDRAGGAHHQLQALAQEQAITADPDGGEANDLAAPAVEACRLRVEYNDLGRMLRLEEKPVGRIAQAGLRSGATVERAMQKLKQGRSRSEGVQAEMIPDALLEALGDEQTVAQAVVLKP